MGASGRPSLYTPEIVEAICNDLAHGKSLVKICELPGMPCYATVANWLADKSKPDFLEKYARAREAQADYLFDEIVEIADDGTRDIRVADDGREIVDYDHIARAKLRVDTRKWAASKLAPKKYGDRIAQEHSGPDGKPLPTERTVIILPANGRES